MIDIQFDLEDFRTYFSELTPLRFSRATNKAVREIAGVALNKYKQTVENWVQKPQFSLDFDLKPSEGYISFAILTDDEIYHWVDEGTPRHTIRAINAKVLAFPATFSPKTTPGSLFTQMAPANELYAYDQEFVFATQVENPGIEARQFTEIILNYIDDKLPDAVFRELEASWGRQQSASSKEN